MAFSWCWNFYEPKFQSAKKVNFVATKNVPYGLKFADQNTVYRHVNILLEISDKNVPFFIFR